jgi:hypothetical protein
MPQNAAYWVHKAEAKACTIRGTESKISILVFRLEVTAEVNIKNPVLWDITPCPLKVTRRFGVEE